MRLATVFLVLSMVVGVALARDGSPAGPAQLASCKQASTDLVRADARYPGVLTGDVVGRGKAPADTVYMMGGPNRLDGKFQLADGATPDRQGWIGVDLTIVTPESIHWSVSDWNGRAVLDPNFSPNHTMWCGEMLTPCPGGDPPQGYGNSYDEWLDWYGTVANNAIATNVTVTCKLNNDSEPGYDMLRFDVMRGTHADEIWTSGGGNNVLVNFSQSFTVNPADYVGPGVNQIHLRFRGTSDSGWSDAVCRYPSYGHSNLDNIQVATNNGVSTNDDFEGGPVHWAPAPPPACGDFSKVWPLLADLDACGINNTPQFAFVDDGNVVPGTGGTPGVTWTYGPGGFVVNPRGGLGGPGSHINNEIWSPPLAWPGPQYAGMQYNFSVWDHTPLSVGIFYTWRVRSSSDGGTTWDQWRAQELMYWSYGAGYENVGNVVTSKILPNRTHVQLALGVWDYGWVWGYSAADPTPSPYFDNVRALAYTFPGPAISARDVDTFQGSNFPASGTIDYANLGNNSVRLDMANNISPRTHLRNDPGDSIVVTVAVARAGATLQGRPKLYYKLHPNPLFDAYRTSGLANQGVRDGDTTKTSAGVVVANSWRWDLPDSNFFFPGDVLHWYVEAQDNLGGDIGTSRMPADTSGFSLFPNMPGYRALLYPSSFIARALPTMKSATPGDQPHILFWNDFANRGGENEWNGALHDLAYFEGQHFDEYYTNSPSSGVGNGLGGRATGAQLAGYTTVLYTSGDLGNYTLSNGDYDPGNDIAVMTNWLSQGHKNWFCTGDALAYDLGKSGTAALAFRNTFLPMTFNATNIRPLIQNQVNPTVVPVAGNPVGLTQSYIAYGGCPVFKHFDAVQATAGSTRIASFQELSGSPYPYAAALCVPNAGGYNDRVVYMPYDFMDIYKIPNTAKAPAVLEKRAQVLSQILTYFGVMPGGDVGVSDTPGAVFTARSYPNPFNPSTKIEYSLPREGRLSIKVYNVRGEVVRTLLDQRTPAGPGSVTWRGDDNDGRPVGSGVYFCQVKSDDGEILNKVTLVK